MLFRRAAKDDSLVLVLYYWRAELFLYSKRPDLSAGASKG
jgi:hypothetical protein